MLRQENIAVMPYSSAHSDRKGDSNHDQPR